MSSTEQSAQPFWSVIFAVFFGNFMAVLSSTTINVALPVFMDDFHAPLNTVQWMSSGFMLATGVIAPAIGFLGDRLGYNRLYVGALAGFTLASALCPFAWSMPSLIILRIIQGLFSGVIMPTTMTIIYQVIGKNKQALAISLWSASAMLAPAFGPTLGGWMVEYFGWKSLFLLNIPVGLAAVAAAWKYIPSYRLGTGRTLDTAGFFCVIAGTSSLLGAFSQSGSWGWTNWKTLLLLIGGALFIAYFVRRSLKVQSPLLDLRLFRIPRYTYSLILNCAITISLYSGTFLIPIYVQKIQHGSTLHTGLVMLPGTILMAAGSFVVGKAYDRAGPFRLIVGGALLLGAASLALSRLNTASGTMMVVIWVAVRYAGIAMSYMPVTNSGMSAVPSVNSGQASALMNWIRQGTAALSVSLFSTLLTTRTNAHLHGNAADAAQSLRAMSKGIEDVFLYGSLLVLVVLPLALTIRNKQTGSAPIPARASATAPAKPD